jgi:Protein of unknown function (DUF3551)
MQQFLNFKIVRCVTLGEFGSARMNARNQIKLPRDGERRRILVRFKNGVAAMKISIKLSISALAFAAAAAALASPAQAQNYPWCALYSGGGAGGGTNCGFVSFEQCMATARGLGSFCYRNTQYIPPPGPHSARRYPYPY